MNRYFAIFELITKEAGWSTQLADDNFKTHTSLPAWQRAEELIEQNGGRRSYTVLEVVTSEHINYADQVEWNSRPQPSSPPEDTDVFS